VAGAGREILAWRTFPGAWTDAMAVATIPGSRLCALPNMIWAGVSCGHRAKFYPVLREIVENVLASALIYLPSKAADFSSGNRANTSINTCVGQTGTQAVGFSVTSKVKLKPYYSSEFEHQDGGSDRSVKCPEFRRESYEPGRASGTGSDRHVPLPWLAKAIRSK